MSSDALQHDVRGKLKADAPLAPLVWFKSGGNAQWLFEHTKVGDPITVQGTEAKLDPGDGWTAWNMSWAEYLKGASR